MLLGTQRASLHGVDVTLLHRVVQSVPPPQRLLQALGT